MADPRVVRAPAGSLRFRAIVDAAVPPLPGHDHRRPMCAAWDDHTRRELDALVRQHSSPSPSGDSP